MSIVYFGHPINLYDTPLEDMLVEMLEKRFHGNKVENPNQEHHKRGYELYKKNLGNGMLYYYRWVLPKMDGGVFLPFRDGAVGAGVYAEAEFLKSRRKPVWEMDVYGEVQPFEFNTSRKLSISETKDRIVVDF